jgi:hypothetical protein
MQHPSIYFCNIKMKQLQHTSEMPKTLKTYICNIGAIGVRAGGEPRHTRLPAPPTLVGGSAGEDLRRHDTCVPAAMAGLAACAMAMGDKRMDGEGASGTGVWDGRATRPAMGRGVVADERMVGEGTHTNEWPYCFGRRDKDK